MPLALACCWSAVQAQGTCRQDGVEWIVGGTGSSICTKDAQRQRIEPGPVRISAALQRLRDEDRRAILASELAQEEHRLTQAGDAQAIARAKGNIAALQREMARLGIPATAQPAGLTPR